MNDDALGRKAGAKRQFNTVAPDYDAGPRCFAHFGRRLVAAAEIQPGQRVLDVASGRGAVLFPCAERVGRTGEVVGVDLAEEMVRTTNEEAARRGMSVQVAASAGTGMRRTLDELNAAEAEWLRAAVKRRVSPDGQNGFYSTSTALIAAGCR